MSWMLHSKFLTQTGPVAIGSAAAVHPKEKGAEKERWPGLLEGLHVTLSSEGSVPRLWGRKANSDLARVWVNSTRIQVTMTQ